MITSMLNQKTQQAEDVDTDKLTDQTALDYLPSSDIPLNQVIIETVYKIYRNTGRTPYQAIVCTLLSLVTGKDVDEWPEDTPTEPLPPTNFGILGIN